MQTKSLAKVFGYASLVCSLSFWVVLTLHYIPGFPKNIDLPFGYWALIWLVAMVLAVVATALGSRRWALAAVVPLMMFVLLTLANLHEPR
jgi:hypothetical protein